MESAENAFGARGLASPGSLLDAFSCTGDLFALGVQEYGFFWKTTSGMFPVFSSPWFDSGYMLGVSPRGLLVSTLQELRILRSCSSSLAVDIPFVLQKVITMVQSAQQIMEILQLLLILVVDVLVVRVMQVLRCCRGKDLGAPTVAAR